MSDFQLGDEVYAPWGEDGFWYPAVLVGFDGDSAHVAYLDGDENDVPVSSLRRGILSPGMTVNVNWKGQRKYYQATVRQRLAQAVLVDYQDGEHGWATVAQCRVLPSVLDAYQPESRNCTYCGAPMEGGTTCRVCGTERRLQ